MSNTPKIKQLQARGMKPREIANVLGISRAAVYKALKVTRPTGRPRKLDYPKVYALRQGGLTLNEIALRLGVTRQAVMYALRSLPR